MHEPKRWRDDGPREARDLFRLAAKTRPMTGEERARTTSRVARIGATGMVIGGLAWMQGLAWGAGVGVVGAAAVHFVPQWVAPAQVASSPSATSAAPSRRAAPPSRAPAPGVVPPPSPLDSSTPRVPSTSGPPSAAPSETAPSGVFAAPLSAALPVPVSPSHSARALPPAGEPSAFPSQPRVAAADRMGPAADRDPDLLAQEAALLDRARALLESSPADALALTDVHAATFLHGALGMERELVAVDALSRLGRVAEARMRGEAFLARTDGGLYVDRVRKIIDEAR